MADYYPLIARAVQGLSDPSPQARQSVYDRARGALLEQLRSLDPPLSTDEIERESLSLDDAIMRVEADYAPPAPEPALAGTAPGPIALGSIPVEPPGAGHDLDAELPPVEPEPPDYAEPPGPARPRIDSRGPIVEKRGRGRAVALGIVLVLAIGAIAVAAWYLRDQPGQLPAQAPVAQAPAPASRPAEGEKFSDRVGGAASPAASPTAPAAPTAPAPMQAPAAAPTAPARPDVAVAQRAILYEEDPSNPQVPKTSSGRAVWRLETVNAGQGQPLETAVRTTIEIPDADLTLNLLMRRNTDATLPASHTVELNFTTRPGDPSRAIRDVGLLQFKDEEASRGTPVAGLPVPVRENLFLIGLSNLRNDIERNMDLILHRNWIDLPIRTASGQRAILSIEKGAAGDQVIEQAFRQWQ